VPAGGGGDPRRAYGVREVADLLGVGVPQLRRFVHAGLLQPERGPRGELRFSFQDLVFLRIVKGLSKGRVPPRRVHRALRRLRDQLPAGEPLSTVRLEAEGGEVVARRNGHRWHPDSGQTLLDFEEAAPARDVVDLGERDEPALEVQMDADDWYRLGCALHEGDPERAFEAYRRALELDPEHADAHVNLGCLHHGAGKLADAEAEYRAALRLRPENATAAFDLAVALEDQARLAEARAAYERCLALDPACADAHYNLARLHDRAGDALAAVRHLREYRRLTEAE
jgi:tetratricopeptide (TPR) repeat protein